MRAQESYIDTFTAQVAAPGLFKVWGLFLSRFEKTEGRGFMNPLHSPEEREHSKTEFEKREF